MCGSYNKGPWPGLVGFLRTRASRSVVFGDSLRAYCVIMCEGYDIAAKILRDGV